VVTMTKWYGRYAELLVKLCSKSLSC
jgi:hypothetical protein